MIKKKALQKTEEKAVTVKSEEKKNKPHSYMKLKIDKKTGVVTASSTKVNDLLYMGTHDLDLTNAIINQVSNICSGGEDHTESTTTFANSMLAAIIEIDPQDSTELMLATQMASVHNVAMEMMRRAMVLNKSFEYVDANINRANKLMRTFTAQMEALNKYRTKGNQKITVQHVNVNEGGQAVIGDINKGGG